ncbi:DUF2786 domain-containing protein [Pseudomonas aeruginosa]|uniref:DUF2786 domain-containing protein n=1 Tax=Pseudomonas aeruginosa TaxID=287 RepID=UPI00053DFDCC|nr:DUF2786 domain-containing protein [Pseudomonas aeruginosa]
MEQTDRDKIIAKVRKCLALAKSSNEHEAANALRQAQKLMQMHGISDLDIEHSDIQEESTRAGAAQKPARWECGLATRVAAAFDCSVFLACNRPVGRWVLVGAAPSGEIARYAFEVLFRQAKRARAHYVKTALKRCTTTRTRRADLFCEGWVMTATELVENFAGSAAAQARVTAYLEHKHTLTSFQGHNRNAGRNLSERDYGDMQAGHRSGRDAQLNRGVGGDERLALGAAL